MSAQCPSEEELIALFDGEATENDAAELRAHLSRCAACREVSASFGEIREALSVPLPGVPAPGATERILARLQAEPLAAEPPRRLRPRVLALAGLIAAAAVFVLVPRLGADREFTARGAPTARSLRRDVGVSVRRGDEQLALLAAGAIVGPGTTYAISYRNLGANGSAHMMVFAVDAARAVHWIQPAYLDAKDDPASLPLTHATSDAVLPAAAELAAPAPGPLRIVTLVTPRPLRVSQIEALTGAELDLARLRARFPDAEIAEIAVDLRVALDAGRQP
jgi:hypothetical protein